MGIDRETLYEEVWAEPMTTVSQRYAVSSSFLARVCERLNVPRPPRGYWAQLKVGKAPERPALPPVRPGDELEWSRSGPPRDSWALRGVSQASPRGGPRRVPCPLFIIRRSARLVTFVSARGRWRPPDARPMEGSSLGAAGLENVNENLLGIPRRLAW